MAGIKINDLPALGRDLASTDLFEMSLAGGTGSRKITGQEIMNTSKLNIGTTPIVSGTVGRVLFEGTGNVVQESANLFWDNTKGALGVFNPTPFSGLTSAGIDIGVYNTVGSEANLSVRGFASLGGTSRGAYGAVGSNYYLEKTTGTLKRTFADIVSLIDFGAGGFRFYTSGGGAIGSAIALSELMQIKANGNVLINTTTDAGFKLDVNGTARVQNQLTTTGTINAATAIARGTYLNQTLVATANNDSLNALEINPTFTTGAFTGVSSRSLKVNYPSGAFHEFFEDASFCLTRSSGKPFAFGQAGAAFSIVAVSANTFYPAIATNQTDLGSASLSWRNLFMAGSAYINTSSVQASAQLQVDSTTKGVLFPRMTTTQKNAIATPATGLELFDSTTLTPSVFNGTNWQNILVPNSNGNVLINTTTDAGYKLDVNGIARVATRIDAGTFTPGAGATAYTIATTGRISAGNGISFRSPVVGDSLFVGFSPIGTGTIEAYTGSTRVFQFGGAGGDPAAMAVATPNFNPSSGTGNKTIFEVNGNYNTTGTFSGTIKGFYYNPSLVSMTGVTSHHAFHSTSGRVRFEGLPTSPAGLNAGDLYNNLGVLMIV